MKCSVVILAAGSSSRMGTPKQLLPYRGTTLLRHAVQTALDSTCSRVIVVLGSSAASVCGSLDGLPVEIVTNPGWEQGMGSSIRAGVLAAAARGDDAVILTLADQPLITPKLYDRLVALQLESGKPIVASEYADTVGVPVLFTAEYFPALMALKPSQGCKGVILANADVAIRVPCPEAEVDVDTQEDLARVAERS